MKNDSYKIWIKFNKYVGNFDREFMAFVLGYESENDDDEYTENKLYYYIEDFKNKAKPLFSLFKKLKFTSKQMDDWIESTCYNIDNYPGEEKGSKAIVIDFDQKPTKEEIDFFTQRVNLFPDFLIKHDSFFKNIKVKKIKIIKHKRKLNNVNC